MTEDEIIEVIHHGIRNAGASDPERVISKCIIAALTAKGYVVAPAPLALKEANFVAWKSGMLNLIELHFNSHNDQQAFYDAALTALFIQHKPAPMIAVKE